MDMYCIECKEKIDEGEESFSHVEGRGPLCPDCLDVENMKEDADGS